MLDFVSFYEGHKGAVLSLAGDPRDNHFYSSGTEGLIVRWKLDKPNEGDVITRLPGLVPSIVYSGKRNSIYAALNQKGIVALDCNTGKKINSIAIPATSFNRMLLLEDFLIVHTKQSELLVLDTALQKIALRIEIGASEQSLIAEGTKANTFWFKDDNGVHLMNLLAEETEKSIFNELLGNVIGIGAMGDYLIALQTTEMIAQNIHKKRAKPIVKELEEIGLASMYSSINAPVLLAVTSDQAVMEMKIEGKTIENGPKSKILHNGAINDLLWSENHKFVLSASADKSIGVWRFN